MRFVTVVCEPHCRLVEVPQAQFWADPAWGLCTGEKTDPKLFNSIPHDSTVLNVCSGHQLKRWYNMWATAMRNSSTLGHHAQRNLFLFYCLPDLRLLCRGRRWIDRLQPMSSSCSERFFRPSTPVNANPSHRRLPAKRCQQPIPEAGHSYQATNATLDFNFPLSAEKSKASSLYAGKYSWLWGYPFAPMRNASGHHLAYAALFWRHSGRYFQRPRNCEIRNTATVMAG